MRKKKKRRPRKTFIEALDSYCDEYEYWKRAAFIKHLVGVFEVAEAQFQLGLEGLLLAAGLGDYSGVLYTSDYDNTGSRDQPISGTGCAIAVRDIYGRIRPVVFVCSDVQSIEENGEANEGNHPQFADSVRLLVLIHELGHADDISKGINYDHEQLKIDLGAAEAYAHSFVCKHAQKNNYTLLLEIYLDNVERMAQSEDDSERVGAELFLQSGDASTIRAWIVERRSQIGMDKFLEKSGRANEIRRKSKDF